MRRAPVLLAPLVLLGAVLAGCGEGEGQSTVDAGGDVVATLEGPDGFELDENGDVLPADGSSPTTTYEEVSDPTYLVRTDFSDDAAWRRVVELVTAGADFGDGYEPYEPYVESLEDRDLEGVTAADLIATAGDGPLEYRILADARSMREAAAGGEVTVLYVDVSAPSEHDDPDVVREMRTATDQVALVEANLSIGNVWFFELADSVDADGVFRGDG